MFSLVTSGDIRDCVVLSVFLHYMAHSCIRVTVPTKTGRQSDFHKMGISAVYFLLCWVCPESHTFEKNEEL